MPSNEVSLTVDFKNVKLVQEIIKKFTDEATRLEERNGILYSHIELLNKALDVLCPLVARTIDFLPSEQFTLRAATREALDNVTYIQNKEYRENTNPDYYKQEIARLNAERRWIPVSERLPEMYHPVLTMAKKAKYPRVLSREKGADDIWVWALRQLGGYVAYIGEKNITHWMPLPEPPESEG